METWVKKGKLTLNLHSWFDMISCLADGRQKSSDYKNKNYIMALSMRL